MVNNSLLALFIVRSEFCVFYVLSSVFPVVELEVVIPDVTDATLSWIVHGNLTQLGLLCQVTADPNGVTMVGFIWCNSFIVTAD